MSGLLQEIRELPVDRRRLRQFGLVVGAVFALIGGTLAWKADFRIQPLWATLAAIGLSLMISGVTAPNALRAVYRVWMGLALVLGFVMTRVLLTLVFFAVVTPIGLVMRAVGRDPMHRRPDPEAPTYWIARDPADSHPDRMKRYF